MPDQKALPERQSLKLPDGGSTANRTDDEIKRRRAMMATAFTGTLGTGGAAPTTTVLG